MTHDDRLLLDRLAIFADHSDHPAAGLARAAAVRIAALLAEVDDVRRRADAYEERLVRAEA